MSSQRKAILLRISADLWEHLNRWARDELRSVNAQIEYVLRDAVQRRGGGLDDARADTHRSKPDRPEGSPPEGGRAAD